MTNLQFLSMMIKETFEKWQNEENLEKRFKLQLEIEEYERDLERLQKYNDSVKKFEELRRVR